MATIEKPTWNDGLQFAKVSLELAGGSEPINQRVSVTADYRMRVIGTLGSNPISGSKTRMLAGHPALTPTERTAFAALAKKVLEYEWNANEIGE